jgi:hypothetical protein
VSEKGFVAGGGEVILQNMEDKLVNDMQMDLVMVNKSLFIAIIANHCN